MRKVTIGRSSQNDYVINDRTNMASRFHADLFINDDGTYTLTDHSTYGTAVNGQPLHKSSRVVRYGDSIVFANAAQFDWGRIGAGFGPGTGSVNGPVNGPVTNKPMAPYAVAAMVLGILSLITPYLGLAMGIVGLCLAANGLKRTKYNRSQYRGIGMLKAGLICSIVALGLWVLAVFAWIIGASYLLF